MRLDVEPSPRTSDSCPDGIRSWVKGVLRDIVVRNSRLKIESVSDGDTLTRDLGFDSFALLMALSDLERSLHLRLPLERIEELSNLSFGELVSFVVTERTTPGPSDEPQHGKPLVQSA